MKIRDILLRTVNDTYPEQYNAIDANDKLLGKLSLLDGYFVVKCPNDEGKTVYDGYPDGDGKFNDYERDGYLESAKMAIAEYWNNKSTD